MWEDHARVNCVVARHSYVFSEADALGFRQGGATATCRERSDTAFSFEGRRTSALGVSRGTSIGSVWHERVEG